MGQSSPEGIILGKGSKLESLDLSINQEKVLAIKQQERSYSEEEVKELIYQAVNDSHCKSNRVKYPNSNECVAFVNEWFEEFKKK